MTNNIAPRNKLLIIDDEENMRHMLTILTEQAGYEVAAAKDGEEALELAKHYFYDFILCDVKMPNMDGMQFLAAARDNITHSTVIMMSAFGTIDMALNAMKQGAYDFISKPFKTDEVLLTLKKAEERENLIRENISLRSQIKNIGKNYKFGLMVAKSKIMLNLFELAAKVSDYNTTVLITGESGTGKELMAKGIHFNGKRSEHAFVAINCGGIPENLLESELFGYKKGAFTGADKDKKGLFEQAHRGTLFLDEIGELPVALQVKLLRMLQESEIRPLGGSETRNVDVRVVAATSKNLEKAIADGSFREDLYYRLNVMPIRLPSLRERFEDIPLLVKRFVKKFSQSMHKDIKDISPVAMSLLLKYHWPGNIRELENVIERATVLADSNMLLPEHLPAEMSNSHDNNPCGINFEGFSLKEAKKIWEKYLIEKALDSTQGNRSKAAELLELSFPSLLSKIKEYEIDV